MNLKSAIANMFGLSRDKQHIRRESTTRLSPRLGGDYSLFGYHDSTAMSVATVYRCVTLLCESVACLPLLYKTKRNGIYVADEDHRLNYLLTIQPNEEYNAFDFWVNVVKEMLLDGNAYILPQYNAASMQIDRLILLSRGSVTRYIDHYSVNDSENGISGDYDINEIVHLMGKTIDGVKGISVLEYARRAISISASGDAQTQNNFETGGMVRGIVGNTESGTVGFGEYQDKELDKAAEDIDAQFRHGARIVSIPGQINFNPISMSAADMQFLDSRKFSVIEICRFFGVHPSFVFADAGSNYKSAEMANVAFLSMTLNPILRKIETELRRKLIPADLATKEKFEFDREGLYACDLESRVNYQTKTLAAGLYTVNEWRQKENMPSVEGGDQVLVSANLKSIHELTEDNNHGQK